MEYRRIALNVALGTMIASGNALAAGGGGVPAAAAVSPETHFHPKGKAPSKHTLEVLERARKTLPFSDTRDFEEDAKGFIGAPDFWQIKNADGAVVWDMGRYKFFLEDKAYPSIHPSLQRQSTLNMNYGLWFTGVSAAGCFRHAASVVTAVTAVALGMPPIANGCGLEPTIKGGFTVSYPGSLGVAVAVAKGSAEPFALVLAGPGLWSHFHMTSGGVLAHYHVDGPLEGKVVVLTHQLALEALLQGGLTAEDALDRGLLAFSGDGADTVRRAFIAGLGPKA